MGNISFVGYYKPHNLCQACNTKNVKDTLLKRILSTPRDNNVPVV